MSSQGQEVLTLHTPVANGANASFGRSGCWFRTERMLVSDGADASFGRMIRASRTDEALIRN